jgi:uncharacterized protein (DUF1810 family)
LRGQTRASARQESRDGQGTGSIEQGSAQAEGGEAQEAERLQPFAEGQGDGAGAVEELSETTAGADPFNLARFVAAQSGGVYERALSELEAGEKRSHWMWFIFPQHRDLGRSATAKVYGLSGEAEARAYAAHPVLGPRLEACFEAIRPWLARKSLDAILCPVDALKFRSSAEIFGRGPFETSR